LDDYAVEVRCSALFGVGYGFAADLSLEGKDRVPFNLALTALASDENIPSSMRDRSLLEAQIRQAVALEFQQYTQYFRNSIIKADISGATKITETQVWQTDWQICKQFLSEP